MNDVDRAYKIEEVVKDLALGHLVPADAPGRLLVRKIAKPKKSKEGIELPAESQKHPDSMAEVLKADDLAHDAGFEVGDIIVAPQYCFNAPLSVFGDGRDHVCMDARQAWIRYPYVLFEED